MTLGDMERLTYLTEFFELENYGIALWKEFGDDVKEPFEAMMKMLDEPECIEDRWLDDEAKGEKWLLEFQELALTEEYREWIRNYIDKNMKKRITISDRSRLRLRGLLFSGLLGGDKRWK
ncbi:hypothetical protein [Eubacterium ramulus]|uniref:hypothetical protein n=1 Tax=Eubacterium ramulus TaxID=39490 RepID=UPI00399AA50B